MTSKLAKFLALIVLSGSMGCYSKWEEQHSEQQRQLAMGVDITASIQKGDPGACPVAQLGTLLLPKCCTKENMCGGDGTMFGYGCSDFADPMFRAYLSNPPDPQPCSGGPAAPSGSAGATTQSTTGAAGASSLAQRTVDPASVMPPLNPPTGTPDARCPAFEIMPGITAQGCCTADEHCGADGSAMGFGCTDLGSQMFRDLFPNAPPPQACDGKPL